MKQPKMISMGNQIGQRDMNDWNSSGMCSNTRVAAARLDNG